MDYNQSGVNVNLGDKISGMLYEAAKLTWKNREGMLGEVITPYDDFSGLRYIEVENLPRGTVMNLGFDGVGTKIELAERILDYSTIAHDLFAMVCDDAVVRGAEPVILGSVLDVNNVNSNHHEFEQLTKGYVNAAKQANVAVINGELAELSDRVRGYGSFNCNWSAAVAWFARKDKLFSGMQILPGDYLIGLKEKGFRSNGLSLARKIMKENYGEYWQLKFINGKSVAEQILEPSKIYSRAIVDMIGGYNQEAKVDVHGIVHVTGGGIPGKLSRVLKPSGLGAVIYDPFDVPEMMSFVQDVGEVSDREAYKTWNMGQGMIVITPDPYNVMRIASNHGIVPRIIGGVDIQPGIIIKSQGVYNNCEELCF
jgi:phosphoribosylformylglycinamidine cyclo-ligase